MKVHERNTETPASCSPKNRCFYYKFYIQIAVKSLPGTPVLRASSTICLLGSAGHQGSWSRPLAVTQAPFDRPAGLAATDRRSDRLGGCPGRLVKACCEKERRREPPDSEKPEVPYKNEAGVLLK